MNKRELLEDNLIASIKIKILEQKLAEQETLLDGAIKVIDDFVLDCERCDRYFQSSSTRRQFQRRLSNKKEAFLEKVKQSE